MRPFLEGFIELLAPSRCLGCEELSARPFCEVCETLLEPSSSAGAVFDYGGPIAEAIHRFKYRGRSDLAKPLGCLMAGAVAELRDEVEAVVPVPLHWRRRRWRGYDQAALLAKPVAESLAVPVLLRGLRRTRNTASQIDLPHHARRKNVAGAFAPGRLHGVSRALLVDDVRTTGATLEAASEALRKGGLREIRTLVLATRLLG